MYSRYVPNKLLIAHKYRLLFTYNDDRAATIRFDASEIDYRPADAIFDS